MNIDKNSHYKYIFSCMSTKCVLQIYSQMQQDISKICKKIENNTRYLEKKYNFYDENSYLNKVINDRKKSKIKIDEQSAKVLKIVKELSEKTNFIFDISTGTYKHCYNFSELDKTNECLRGLKNKTGFDTFKIKNRWLEFKHKETKLDLGGVIKEYAVDEAVRILRENGVKSAIVNFGGDIYALGKKLDGQAFVVGVKNPKNKAEDLLHVKISNQALTTSAHYERSYEIEDKTFSHILSKEDYIQDILSATIISDSVLKSGIYSTSFMINTDINIPNDLKVILIDKELKLHQNLT